MGISSYLISPTDREDGALYRGFQTRPRNAGGTFAIADAAHLNTGDCSQCHSSTAFSAIDKPGQPHPDRGQRRVLSLPHHQRLLGDACASPTSTPDAQQPPTTARSATAAAAPQLLPFRRPTSASSACLPTTSRRRPRARSATGTNRNITAVPVVDSAKFSGSRASRRHHQQLRGLPPAFGQHGDLRPASRRIVGMPPTSPMGAARRIPSGTTCESCHLGTLANVSGLIPASARAPRPARCSPRRRRPERRSTPA